MVSIFIELRDLMGGKASELQRPFVLPEFGKAYDLSSGRLMEREQWRAT